MQIGGWHRVFIVVAAGYLMTSTAFFVNDYPTTSALMAEINREFSERKAAIDKEAQKKLHIKCEKERLAEKRSSLSPQELADVDEPLNMNADPAISIERKIKANRNHMYLFYGSKDDAIVEECVRLANRDVRISLTSVIDELKAKEFTHDLRLPTYAAMQDDYIVKALLIILAPVFMLYGLGLVASWVFKGFVSSSKK